MQWRGKARQIRLTDENLERLVKGELPVGRMILLEVEDHKRQAREFFSKKAEWELTTGEEKYLTATLETWYRPRTVKQNNLQWEICSRIAAEDLVSSSSVHDALRELAYPKEERYGILVPMEGNELSTVQYAHVIEAAIMLAVSHEPPIDIYDIWILFTEWRFGQERDPLQGTYDGPQDYREKHPLCEACGAYLLKTSGYGVEGHRGHLAHIYGRGAAGEQLMGAKDDWDWLMLCEECHHALDDQSPEDFKRRYEHLAPKIAVAMVRGASLHRDEPEQELEIF